MPTRQRHHRRPQGNRFGANLFYTRMAMDYLFWYRLQEMLDPGAIRRMERRLEQRTGQEYLISPAEAVR